MTDPTSNPITFLQQHVRDLKHEIETLTEENRKLKSNREHLEKRLKKLIASDDFQKDAEFNRLIHLVIEYEAHIYNQFRIRREAVEGKVAPPAEIAPETKEIRVMSKA